MARVRRDVATLGAGWSPELEWYAKAVRALQAKPASDRTSWRYLGGIHGYDQQTWIEARVIQEGDPLPPDNEWNGRMWNQCQHQGWWFIPWHRGYLAAFEAIVAKTIEDLEGPPGWALPYWNYLDTSNPSARHIPQPFLEPKLPDGSANPLSAPPRGGIDVLGPVPWFPNDIDLSAMDIHRFTSAPGALGFGGGATVFAQFGGKTGALESNPHNAVHVIVGGPNGFMFDPVLAGLDPIFWLHHCNIDRLWAAWLTRPANVQESSQAWRNGPSPRRFEMPDPSGNLGVFTPEQVLPGGPLAPEYDDLQSGTGTGVMIAALDGAAGDRGAMPAQMSSEPPKAATLVGANEAAVTVDRVPVTTTVRLEPQAATIAGDPVEQRVVLNLENVRGTQPSGVLTITLSVPAKGTMPASAPRAVTSVALFGLARASAPEGEHGGGGMNVAVDITGTARELAQQSGGALDRIEVHLDQPAHDKRAPITVGRVSIYKQPVE